ncbi:MAG: AAA family ATPase, partial [bacterium]
MYNLIPRFICSAYNQQISKGSFFGSILYVDINNYTNLADHLKKFEFEGAEQLSVILNKIFEKLIKAIYRESGFVSNFAGDSLIVIFKNTNIDKAYKSSQKIRDIFIKYRIIKTSFGDFDLSAKFGLSYGKISWGIVGTEDQKTYYFKGSPINNAIKISQKSHNFRIEIKKRKLSKQAKEHPRKFKVHKQINLNTIKKFFSSSVIKYPYSGEFREVISTFIGFPHTDSYQKINSYSSKLIDIAKIYHGYVNSLEFSDKGPLFLVVFGAPTSYENNLVHALDFALQLDRFLPRTFKISISWGTVYSGILGSKTRCTYTVLGDAVNQAAKILQKIAFNEIVVTNPVFKRTKNRYNYSDLPQIFIKGKNKKLKIYRLNHKLTNIKYFKSKNQMVGRDEEFNKIIDFFNPLNQIKSSKIVLITGEPGIGKSRLCQEIERNLNDNFIFFNLRGDEVRDDSFFMFKIFFKDYFSISELDCNEDNLKKFNLKWQKIYDSFVDNKNFLSQEFVRTKPVLSNLTGLYLQDFQFFDRLQPKVKYLNIISAVKTFFRAVSNKHPLIIIFDDIQWMDKDSKELFEELMVNIENFPISFIASYRSEFKNYIFDLDIPKNYQILKVNLDKLNTETISELSRQIFKIQPDDRLLNFLAEKSSGNPFYLEQYAYFLLENNLLKSNKLVTSLNSENLSIPPTIREILIARIDRLSDHLKELIKNASVLGLEFDINILSGMLEKKLTEEILKEGEQEKVIQSLTELIYIFQHAMIRETIYTMQLKSQLEKLHSKAAKCIANVYPDEGENYYNIAYHYQKA